MHCWFFHDFRLNKSRSINSRELRATSWVQMSDGHGPAPHRTDYWFGQRFVSSQWPRLEGAANPFQRPWNALHASRWGACAKPAVLDGKKKWNSRHMFLALLSGDSWWDTIVSTLAHHDQKLFLILPTTKKEKQAFSALGPLKFHEVLHCPFMEGKTRTSTCWTMVAWWVFNVFGISIPDSKHTYIVLGQLLFGPWKLAPWFIPSIWVVSLLPSLQARTTRA